MNQEIRNQFPSLKRTYKNQKLVFFDGPAGTQVPRSVIRAISRYYERSNANSHGHFITAKETDKVIQQARQKMADFLGAESYQNISFGQNMTTLNYSLSRAIGRTLQKGDEILITQLDHESNRAPWLSLREMGIVVKEINLLPNGQLDYEHFESQLNERTRLVAMGYAANIFGTINDIHLARKLTYKVGAHLLIDAVHAAPHTAIDVKEIGCDFLICSAYKFYGPHVGILYTKPGLLDRLPTDRLRTSDQRAPYSIETGTPNHAALAGVSAAVDFIASLGEGDSYRAKINSAMQQISAYELSLAKRLTKGLQANPKVKLYGPDFETSMRAPTLAFTHEDITANELCAHLATKGICAWSGHFYAIRSTEVLGLLESGGVTRMGMVIYNTEEEVDYVLSVVNGL